MGLDAGTTGSSADVDVHTLTDHVIVCGLRALGIRIVEQLYRSGTAVVVIDDDPDHRLLPLLDDWNVPFVRGSPRQPSVLVAAGALRSIAVICVEDDDLRSLESALVAHDLRPDLPVVAEIANPSVAQALRGVIGAGRVLDVAALAAPSIIQACLDERAHDLSLEGVDFVVLDVRCRNPGTLRNLFADLVPLAVVPLGTSEVEICPGRDFQVSTDDVVTVLGTPDDLTMMGLQPAPERHRHALDTLRGDPLRLGRWLWSEIPGSLRLALAAILALAATSTVVLHLGYSASRGRHLGVLDSLYFTVETISTVGYGDFTFSTQATWLRVFGIALIILGAASVTTLFALITSTLFTRSIASVFGHQRITRMRGHVVIIGLGAIGVRVVQGLLAREIPVVVIERDEQNRHLAQARALGVPVLAGNATEPSTLDAANTRVASAVAALTSSDLTNLETGLVLREYQTDAGVPDMPTVLRIFDRNLSHSIERNFSFRAVRSTAALAAPWFIGAALGLGILSTFYVERQLFLVARISVADTGGLVGLPMTELGARIRVIAIRRATGSGGLEHPVRRGTRFAPGDVAYLIGPHEELLVVLRRDGLAAQHDDPVGPPAQAGLGDNR